MVPRAPRAGTGAGPVALVVAFLLGVACTAAPPPATPPVTLADHGPVGAHGPAILRAEVPRMVVEVDRQRGVALPDAVPVHLMRTLRRHARKPGGVRGAGGEIVDRGGTRWDSTAIRALEAAHRTTRSGADQVSVYVVALRGHYVEDGAATPAVGVAVDASVVALFPDRWRALHADPETLGRAVVVHELGHLLGLVELTYESRHDRTDPDHPGHSRSPRSVMRWAVESGRAPLPRGRPPPVRFDAADRADIALIREGRGGDGRGGEGTGVGARPGAASGQ